MHKKYGLLQAKTYCCLQLTSLPGTLSAALITSPFRPELCRLSTPMETFLKSNFYDAFVSIQRAYSTHEIVPITRGNAKLSPYILAEKCDRVRAHVRQYVGELIQQWIAYATCCERSFRYGGEGVGWSDGRLCLIAFLVSSLWTVYGHR